MNINHLLLLLVGPTLLITLALLGLARLSYHNRPNIGLVAGKLRGCPKTPNCYSTENNPEAAIQFAPDDREKAWLGLHQVITARGGNISSADDDYLWATFSSRLFGFVDDLEARVDQENHLIHLRSASRIGYSDFAANRHRVEAIKQQVAIQLNKSLLKNSSDAPATR